MRLETNRVYKSRAGSLYKITKIDKMAYGENILPGHRIKVNWQITGKYASTESPLDLIEDVTNDYPEEIL